MGQQCVELLNDRVDRRRPRRALTPDELRLLLAVTFESPDIVHSLNGRERALLYWLAIETGFRYSELHSLTRSSFDLDDDPALVWVKAKNEKARRGATQSIRAELAGELKRYFADKPAAPDAQAFPMPSTRGAEILRHDLKAAGIPYRDEVTQEYFDFHALRGQLGTLLARAGVPLTATQKIMRHCDPKLTANYYTFHSRKDRAEDLAKLPHFGFENAANKQAQHGGKSVAKKVRLQKPEKNSDCFSDCFCTRKNEKPRLTANLEGGCDVPDEGWSGHEKTPENGGFSALSGASLYWHPLGVPKCAITCSK